MDYKRKHGDSGYLLSGTVVWLLSFALSAAVLGWLISPVSVSNREILVLMNAALAIVPFVGAVMTKRFDVFEPIYLFSVSFVVLFVVRPFFDLSAPDGLSNFLGRSVEDGYTEALLIGMLGCIGMYVGYYSALGRRAHYHFPRLSETWRADILFFGTGLLLGTAAVLTFLMIRQLGGLSEFMSFASGRSQQRADFVTSSSGYVYTAPLWLSSVGMLLAALSKSLLSLLGMVGLSLIALSQITSLAAGNRSWFIPAVMALIILAYLRRSARPSIPTILWSGGLAFLLLVTLPRNFRYVTSRDVSLLSAISDTVTRPLVALGSFFKSLDTAMINLLALETALVPSETGYQYGRTYIGDLARPIPRAFWPGKPGSGDEEIMKLTVPDFYAQGVHLYGSIFAEPYFNFGYLGVIVFAILFGIYWRILYEWFLSNPANRTMQALYAVNWPFVFIYMRGGVGTDYQRQAIFVLPMLFLAFLAMTTTKSESAVPSPRQRRSPMAYKY